MAFKYHMFGAHVGSSAVQIQYSNGVWWQVWHQLGQVPRSSREGWLEVTRTFPATARKVRFVALTGQGFGDIAIADVSLDVPPVFTVTSGQCTVANDCAASPNYPSETGDHACAITVNTHATLSVSYFRVHSSHHDDGLYVSGIRYSNTVGPDDVRVNSGTEIRWRPRPPTTGAFRICATALHPSIPATCHDSELNGDEIGVDCGGSCLACVSSKRLCKAAHTDNPRRTRFCQGLWTIETSGRHPFQWEQYAGAAAVAAGQHPVHLFTSAGPSGDPEELFWRGTSDGLGTWEIPDRQVSYLVSALGSYIGVSFKYYMGSADGYYGIEWIGPLKVEVLRSSGWSEVWQHDRIVQLFGADPWEVVNLNFPVAQRVRFAATERRGGLGLADLHLYFAPHAAALILTSGPCAVADDCVASPNYPAPYNNSQACSVVVQTAALLSSDTFATEAGYDLLRVSGVAYSGDAAPHNVVVAAGSVILWTSDDSVTRSGFRVCAGAPRVHPATGPVADFQCGSRADDISNEEVRPTFETVSECMTHCIGYGYFALECPTIDGMRCYCSNFPRNNRMATDCRLLKPRSVSAGCNGYFGAAIRHEGEGGIGYALGGAGVFAYHRHMLYLLRITRSVTTPPIPQTTDYYTIHLLEIQTRDSAGNVLPLSTFAANPFEARPTFPVANCIDGDLSSMCRTANANLSSPEVWLQWNLPSPWSLAEIRLWNRLDCCQDRIVGAMLTVMKPESDVELLRYTFRAAQATYLIPFSLYYTDGLQNQGETGVDCGGAVCPACATCSDQVQNQDETGVDCGGSICNACGRELQPPACFEQTDAVACLSHVDRQHASWLQPYGIDPAQPCAWCCGHPCPGSANLCEAQGWLQRQSSHAGASIAWPGQSACPATCADSILNGEEVGVDCGGPHCPVCSGFRFRITRPAKLPPLAGDPTPHVLNLREVKGYDAGRHLLPFVNPTTDAVGTDPRFPATHAFDGDLGTYSHTNLEPALPTQDLWLEWGMEDAAALAPLMSTI